MFYKVADIVKDVLALLDIADDAHEDLLENSSRKIGDVVKSNIEDAALTILREAPLLRLGSGVPYDDVSVAWHQSRGVGSGYIVMPDDFLRLVSLQMSDWRRSVNGDELITKSHPLYARQQSRFAGIKGNPHNPVVALVDHAGGWALEFYSCYGGEGVVVDDIRYIQTPKIVDGEIEIPERVYEGVKYMICYLTDQTLGIGKAAYYLDLARNFAGLNTQQK